jgi:hypothetical protein
MVLITVELPVRLAWTFAGSTVTALAAKAATLDMASSAPAAATVLIEPVMTHDYITAGSRPAI